MSVGDKRLGRDNNRGALLRRRFLGEEKMREIDSLTPMIGNWKID